MENLIFPGCYHFSLLFKLLINNQQIIYLIARPDTKCLYFLIIKKKLTKLIRRCTTEFHNPVTLLSNQIF